jgi:ribose 5-phosphate isomerase B
MHSESESLAIVDAFIDTKFSNDGRHMRRINQISEYENGGKMPPLPN